MDAHAITGLLVLSAAGAFGTVLLILVDRGIRNAHNQTTVQYAEFHVGLALLVGGCLPCFAPAFFFTIVLGLGLVLVGAREVTRNKSHPPPNTGRLLHPLRETARREIAAALGDGLHDFAAFLAFTIPSRHAPALSDSSGVDA